MIRVNTLRLEAVLTFGGTCVVLLCGLSDEGENQRDGVRPEAFWRRSFARA